MYLRTGKRSASGLLGYSLGEAPMCAPDAATNGRLCSFVSKHGGSTTAVYVPDAARGVDPLCLLVWIHGDLICGDEGPNAVTYVKGKTFPFIRQIADSKRPFVLVVPSMHWKAKQGSHLLGSPQNMNAFLEEVRAGLSGAGMSAPSFGRLILAGHSRAYAALNGLAAHVNDAQSSQGALATLSDVWLLDTTYGKLNKQFHCNNWLRWAKAKSDVKLRILYRLKSDTAAVAECIRDEAAKAGLANVAVEDFEPKSLGHCEMPRVKMPGLLAAAGNCNARSTDRPLSPPAPLPSPPAPAPQSPNGSPSGGSLVQRIQNALASGQWTLALGLAVLSGNRDANNLTNMIFFARHPELKGRKLLPTDPNFKQFSQEWIDIRDRIIRPYLAKTPPAKTAPARTSPTAPVKPVVSGAAYPEVNTLLPPNGPGYHRRKDEKRSYGLPETVRALQEISAAWQEAHPNGPRIVISDISPPGGSIGQFKPHSSHRVGLDVDLNLEGGKASWKNKKGPLINNRWTWVTNPSYSRALTAELARLILNHPKGGLKVKFILFDDPEVRSISDLIKKDDKSPHLDHLHVRFCAPTYFESKVAKYKC